MDSGRKFKIRRTTDAPRPAPSFVTAPMVAAVAVFLAAPAALDKHHTDTTPIVTPWVRTNPLALPPCLPPPNSYVMSNNIDLEGDEYSTPDVRRTIHDLLHGVPQRNTNMMATVAPRCGVCGDVTPHDPTPLLRCHTCGAATHPECLPIPPNYTPSSGTPYTVWSCDPCRRLGPHTLSRRGLCCVVCQRPHAEDPSLLLVATTEDGAFAHAVCARMTPNVRTVNGAVDTRAITSAQRALHCAVCGHTGGACVQCLFHSCTVAVHAPCAVARALHTPPPAWGMYCPRHFAHYCEIDALLSDTEDATVRSSDSGLNPPAMHSYPGGERSKGYPSNKINHSQRNPTRYAVFGLRE